MTTQTTDDILDHLRKTMNELFELEDSQLTPDARLYEDLDIDSIDAVDLLIELKKFTGGKAIEPAQFKDARTIQDVIDIISKANND